MRNLLLTSLLCLAALLPGIAAAQATHWSDAGNRNTAWPTTGPIENGAVQLTINSEQDFAQMAWLVNNAGHTFGGSADTVITLTRALDLSAYLWEPVGNQKTSGTSPYFRGTFDGDTFPIRGLRVDKSADIGDRCAGLFGYMHSGTLCNILLEAPQVTGVDQLSGYDYYTGALVGFINIGSIRNCHTIGGGGFVRGGKTSTNSHTGGLAGYFVGSLGSTIYMQNCSNHLPVIGGEAGRTSLTGGLAGISIYMTLSDSYNTGVVTAGAGNSQTGGLVGFVESVTIIRCYNSGAVAGGTGSGTHDTGGLVGINRGNTIRYCLVVAPSVSGDGANIQRIVGVNGSIGPFTGNYAWAGMAGATWTPDDGTGLDGADWSGAMTDAPLENGTNDWDGANVWMIDATHRLMPKLRAFADQPDIPNPAYYKTVVLDLGYGGLTDTLYNVGIDSLLVAPSPDPTRTGYTFDAWCIDAALATPWTFGTDRVTRDTTLYARWIPHLYKVALDYQHSSLTDTLYNVAHDSVLVAPTPAPTRTGYSFGGWFTDAAATAPWTFGTDVVTSDTTLYALWRAVPVVVPPVPPITEYVSVFVNIALDDPDMRDHIGLNPIEGETEVEKGKKFELRVWLNQHTDLSALAVSANGQLLQPVRTEQQPPSAQSLLRAVVWTSELIYVYELTPQDDLQIHISGIRWNTGSNPTGIASLPNPSQGGAKVYTAPGQIVIEGLTDNARVHIYNVSGQLIFSSPQGGGRVGAVVPRGIYIVAVDGQRWKVVVN